MLRDLLEWRYACKKMNPAKVVPEETLTRILEATRLTATSSGLQPFTVLVITNKEIREKIQAVSNNQTPVTECSHLLVFAAWDTYTAERINAVYDHIEAERGGPNEGLTAYRQKLLDGYVPRDPELNFQHAARQSYIALGSALIAAAEEKVDSVPMEGFDPNAVDEILGLRAQGLRSVTMLPLGYRADEGDWNEHLKKVRRPMEDFVTIIK